MFLGDIDGPDQFEAEGETNVIVTESGKEIGFAIILMWAVLSNFNKKKVVYYLKLKTGKKSTPPFMRLLACYVAVSRYSIITMSVKITILISTDTY